ncbi:MAG: hypothetical protein KDE03_09755 [Rhodobacteraceae bacterium]|nr:hypothetical protein [Paracoccaceae bacterium]
MVWIFTLVAAALASEALLRLPLMDSVRRVIATSRKSGKVLASKRISDHWKEKVLLNYALTIGKGSILFFILLCAALLPVALLGLVFPGGLAAWTEALLRPSVMAVLCVASMAYIWLRLKVARV